MFEKSREFFVGKVPDYDVCAATVPYALLVLFLAYLVL